MQWTKTPSGDWRILRDGRLLAEVQYQGDGTFRWQRFTTVQEDGILPAWGTADSRREAQKRATQGILSTDAK